MQAQNDLILILAAWLTCSYFQYDYTFNDYNGKDFRDED